MIVLIVSVAVQMIQIPTMTLQIQQISNVYYVKI